MKSSMQTIGFLLFSFFFFTFCLGSCKSEAAIDRSGYTQRSFDARIVGELDGERIEGILHNRPDAEPGKVDVLFCFEAPLSVKGVTVCRDSEGNISASLGEMTLSDHFFEPLSDIFLPVVDMGEISSVTGNGDGSVTVRICDENCNLEYIFPPDGDLPDRIRGTFRGRSIDIGISTEGIKK